MRLTILVLATALAATAPVSARPPYKQALADHFGPFLARSLNDCRTCHVPGETKEDEDKPHNPFGARLKEVRGELRKAGKKLDIPNRLDAVADEDADGDGVPNLLELLTGHNPGEKNDKPAPAEIVEVRKTLPAFARFRQSYPWRPYQVVKRPEVPKAGAGWVRNPIDAFIAAEHAERGLKSRPEAPRHVLVRRVYLDLVGLPPTNEELERALSDKSADWYEKVVEKLLNSPRYGERWGRHWMDVWRYSDWAGWTGGNQIRDSQPHIWRWRDWIVESLNDDKPYDRMVLEMLAGDELAPDDPATLRATGYLVRNYKMLSREKWLQDTVEHTFQAFLGTTIGCARCHDHMYDPIPQREYYQVRAVFEPHQVRTDPVPGTLDPKKDGLVRAYDADAKAPTYFFIRGDDRTPDKSKVIEPGVPEALGGRFAEIEELKLPLIATAPEKQPWVVRELLKSSETELGKQRDALASARRLAVPSVVSLLGGSPPVAVATAQRLVESLTMTELASQLAEAKFAALSAVIKVEQIEDAGRKDSLEWKEAATAAGTAQRRQAVLETRRVLHTAEQAERAAPEKTRAGLTKKTAAAREALAKAEKAAEANPTPAYTPRPIKNYPPTSTGRRLAFARWIADKENPLTARVAVNHIWLRHFGQAIVPRTFDFGKNGQRPTQPALLDWLAAELMEPTQAGRPAAGAPWSMKHIHRLILTSATYRMASTPDDACLALDRDNRYLWRMNSRRMEAEVVRDCLFHVAGKLDLAMGGPDIDHNQGLTLPRRSVYFRHAQEKQMEFLKIFDTASVTECYERRESVIPQQALALANSELAIRHGRLIARALATTAGDDPEAFIKAAFARVLCRPPSPQELAECAAFLKEQAARLSKGPAPADERAPAADPALRARESLVHVLLNHHDFVTIR